MNPPITEEEFLAAVRTIFTGYKELVDALRHPMPTYLSKKFESALKYYEEHGFGREKE